MVLSDIGAGVMLVAGAMFLLGVHNGTFLGGEPTTTLGLAGAQIPIGAAPFVGAVLIVVALALLWTGGHTAGAGPHAATTSSSPSSPASSDAF